MAAYVLFLFLPYKSILQPYLSLSRLHTLTEHRKVKTLNIHYHGSLTGSGHGRWSFSPETRSDRQPHPSRNSRGDGCLCGGDCPSLELALCSLVFVAFQGNITIDIPKKQTKKSTKSSQMLVIAFHEFGHAITACCTGGRVKSISLDPHEGGVIHMQGGISAVTLPAGYLGSSIIGALLIFAGFNIVASKVASIILGVCFLLTLWWARRDWLTIITVLLAVGLLVACWFIAHGEALRWVVVSIVRLCFTFR